MSFPVITRQRLRPTIALEMNNFGTTHGSSIGTGTPVIRALVLLLMLFVTACSTTPYVWGSDLPPERARPEEPSKTINPGDTVSVLVAAQPTMSGEHVVGTDGSIIIPDGGAVQVSDMTPAKAAQAIERKLAPILQEPRVTVVMGARKVEVDVLGEVQQPGKYLVKSGDGVASALAMAGGLTEFANRTAIYVVRPGEPMRIRFSMGELVRGGSSARSFALRNGDLLVVE